MGVAEQVYKQLYKYLTGLLSMAQLEKWVYEQDDLLYEVSPGLHTDLITFNFIQKDAEQKLDQLVYQITQVHAYDQWREQKAEIELRTIIEGIVDKAPVWEQLLRYCYWDLWDDSSKFKFLDLLADIGAFSSHSLAALGLPPETNLYREEILETIIYPQARQEAGLLLHWLDTKAIRIIREFEYVDYRSEELKNRTIFREIIARIKALTNQSPVE